MTLDLFAGINGPYIAPAATSPSAPVPTLPTPTLPLTPPTPTPTVPLPRPAPPAQPAAPATAPTATAWWSVEHHATDGVRHTYCGPCYARIPEFLIRESNQLAEPDEPAARCEGCGDGPDLTAETVEVLAGLLAAVRAGEPCPTTSELGDTVTAACLEHARRCVLLCAAARGIDV